jgi:uncharacterized protein (TIGR00251 family)
MAASPAPAGVVLSVKVVPGASRDRVAGRHGEGVRVQVSAPPEGGRANRAAAEVLAAAIGVDPRRVALVSGATSPRKTFRVAGWSEADRARFLASLP